MTDQTDDTALENDDAPDAGASAATKGPDELAQLKNRNAGLNSKVTTLQKQIDDLTAELANARKGLSDKDSADADLKKQIADLQEKLDAQTQAATVASLKASYPESFAELGDAIIGMKAEQLASLEARLTQAADDGEETTEPKKPVGNNPARGGSGTKNLEDMTVAELRAYGKTLTKADMGLATN